MRIKTIGWGRTLSVNFQGRRFDVTIEIGEHDSPIDALEAAQYLVDEMIPFEVRSARDYLESERDVLSGTKLRVVEAMLDGDTFGVEE